MEPLTAALNFFTALVQLRMMYLESLGAVERAAEAKAFYDATQWIRDLVALLATQIQHVETKKISSKDYLNSAGRQMGGG